ncbi:MAG: DAK2 domain-containing protein [Acidibacillus sp.]|nr:DAK2 domain-containing protein [Acidibacillus sp.]
MQQQGRLDAAGFLAMLQSGQQELGKHKEDVNALNVFPVPDGDTGTNMYLSYTSGIDQVLSLPEGTALEQVVSAFSAGLLMGARGNSGVILSQLFRGFQLAFGKATEVDAPLFAAALQNGVRIAYKAVSRPVEGTILTVAREAALAAESAVKKQDVTIEAVMLATLKRAEQVLDKTPDMLPILRQAGVVDSGGQGLVYIYRGFLSVLSGSLTPLVERSSNKDDTHSTATSTASLAFASSEVHGEGEYGYCTEFIIRLDSDKISEVAERQVRDVMETHGDSLLVVQADDLIKVHVHTLHPGAALESAQHFGALIRIKIDNMTEQNQALMEKPKVETKTLKKVCGLVAVAAGEGFSEIFRGLSTDVVVHGGQTMNPSTEDLLAAANNVAADYVILLPNNRNIIMAAQQAAAVSNGRIHVVETHSIGQGLAAALVYQENHTVSENEKAMKEAISHIMSGSITTAVRDTMVGDHAIVEGDYIGISEGEITFVHSVRADVLVSMLEYFCGRKAEICTVFYQESGLVSEVEEAFESLSKRYPEVEFELQYGGQPLYSYLIAAE